MARTLTHTKKVKPAAKAKLLTVQAPSKKRKAAAEKMSQRTQATAHQIHTTWRTEETPVKMAKGNAAAAIET